ELVARALHNASTRSGGPFVAINCGAVTESLFESEMFGHIKGAFTGAVLEREGLFQAANSGTLFLDEVAELPLSMQVKLLRVLQERKVRRVGATRSEPIDVRLVAATHRDLEERVADGTFREDLYYRLAAFVVELPALRARREDIALIAHSLLERIAPSTVGRQLRLEPEGAQLLMQSEWRGNVRELENVLRAACVLADGDAIGLRELSSLVRLRAADDHGARGTGRRQASAHKLRTLPPAPDPRGRKPKASREQVVRALDRTGGVVDEAATLLGVSARTVYRYMKKWGL
ncbi:MAG: sigma-54 dependent transcriptional regulator, partial [Myxococcota bacterium]